MSSSQPNRLLSTAPSPVNPVESESQAAMASDTERFQLNVEVRQAYDLPIVGLRKRGRRYYVSVLVDEIVRRTRSIKSSKDLGFVWNEQLLFESVSDLSMIKLEVYADRNIHDDECVGSISETVFDIFSRPESDNTISLHHASYGSAKVHIFVSKTLDALEGIGNVVGIAEDRVKTVISSWLPGVSTTVSMLGEASQGAADIAAIWDPLIKKLSAFTKLVDTVSEIHPYAKMTWSIISAVNKALLVQVERDKKVKSLLVTIHDMYKLLEDADAMKNVEMHRKTFVALAKQTLECAYFISSYFQSPKFRSRILQNTFSSNDSIIDQYVDNFEKIKECLQQGHSLHIDIVVTQMMTSVENIAKEVTFSDMPYAAGASYDSSKKCLQNTRDLLIADITEWILDPNSLQQVLLLTGPAGMGKSSIAHTIAGNFRELKRLGSCFCFSRTYQTERSADIMFSNIAQDLAAFSSSFKTLLCNQVQSKSDRTTKDIEMQFERFIFEPMSHLHASGPILIIIDALDECDRGISFEKILDILANRAKELPSNIRILVTSRPERDILDFFQHNLSTQWKTLDASVPAVLSFIKSKLQPAHSSFIFSDLQCVELSELSQGLFQWASVVCHTLMKTKKGGNTPVNAYNAFMTSAKPQRSHNILDDLYKSILQSNFDSSDPQVMANFQLVMGIILTLREPITKQSLQHLVKALQLTDFDLVSSVINSMGALLSGVHEDSIVIKPLHSSFHDFLTQKMESNVFHTDNFVPHAHIAIGCLRTMNTELHVNICQLSTSSVYNSSIPDISKHIPEHVSYVCQYWAFHLTSVEYTLEFMNQVKEMMAFFLNENLLFWLEVLSVLQQVNAGGHILSLLVTWSIKHQLEFTEFLRDADRFVGTFGYAIAQSTPHIYISALPFTPKSSLLRQQYVLRFSNSLQLVTGQDLTWPALQNVLKGHTDQIKSVKFSPDGRFIASADLTVRLWDSATGEDVLKPFVGHTDYINSISFSGDGKYIASGSNDHTVRVWDVNTGRTIFGPFEGHTNNITSVAFASNGRWIVSGSEDTTIKLWDIHNGLIRSFVEHDHTGIVYSVVFSPDCKTLASSSSDDIIRIWNVEAAEIQKTLKGHTDDVNSVSFSLDASKLASGSDDNSIRVWDPATGTLIAGPFLGHSAEVFCVSLSPDGTKVVSGSDDKTVRVWNTLTGELVAVPFVGHSHGVRSVAFSPNGTRIASGSYDTTIRVWDAEIRETNSAPYNVHSEGINSVSTSSDGRLIASGSNDHTIRIWDAKTGDLISGPFEGHYDSVQSVAFAPDSKKIASGSTDNTTIIWDVWTGKQIGEPLHGHTDVVSSVAFSSDGTTIVSGSNDGKIRLWNAETGAALMKPLEGYTGRIWSVAFSPDGLTIAGSGNKTVPIWNAATGAPLLEPFKGHTDWVMSVAFSSNGLHIASGSKDHTIRVWNLATGQTIAGPFEGHTNWVTSVAFSPDGQWIASGSYDRTVRVWNARTGDIVAGPYKGHTDWVKSVAFYSDGQKIVSGSSDKTIRIWDLSSSCHDLLSAENHEDIAHEKAWTDQFVFSTDGWVKTPDSELLFWISPLHRSNFYQSLNMMIIGEGATKLNRDKFKHGKLWTECYTP